MEGVCGITPVVVYRQQVVKPAHDTKTTLEISQGLAKRLGLYQYFDFTMEQWVAAQAKELPGEAPLEHLKKHGVFVPPGFPTYATTLNAAHPFTPKPAHLPSFSDPSQQPNYDPFPTSH